MIISHRHKIIFLKTKKTAGTSFEIALSKFCGEEDVVTPISPKDEEIRRNLGFSGPRNYTVTSEKGEKVKLYNHIDARSLKRVLPKEIWSYKKIGILRDPYECIVSWYFWALRGRSDKYTLTEFLLKYPETVVENYNLVKVNGKSVLDFTISYSNLNEDVRRLEKDIPSLEGLFDTFSTIRAKGDVRPKGNVGSASELFKDNPKASRLVELLLEDEILAKLYV